ncbi:MAG: glycosyl transferase [Benniella sp.]|nr:MAG: glycosyl transferase [Benniella sp.]
MGLRFTRRRQLILLVVLFLSATFLYSYTYVFIDLGYLTRPIWDKSQEQWDKIIVHHYAEGMTLKDRCEAHGWTLRPETEPTPKLYDAVIFSVELDMLEIRIREMWDVVDHFVILESNTTFTGNPKNETFKEYKERFAFASSKISYKSVPLRSLRPGETPWVNEGNMRRAMTDFLVESGIQDNDLVIFADVDEVVQRETAELLKACVGVPDSMHLQMQNYLYSYEFPVTDAGMWRPSFHRWQRGQTYYQHGRSSEILFYASGWHCSFCFRTIDDFVFKMLAYSHVDRVRSKSLLDHKWIQETICEGKDLFGMFPEAYSFRELFSRLGAIPKSHSAVGLPKWVLENREQFRYLLPGGCIREK